MDSLSHLTLTYESLKHKKAPNSRYESVWLATHKDSLTKNQFCIFTFFVIVTKAHIFFPVLKKEDKAKAPQKSWEMHLARQPIHPLLTKASPEMSSGEGYQLRSHS